MNCKFLGLYGMCKNCNSFSVEENNNFFWDNVCTDKHNLNLWKMCEKCDGELSSKPSRIVNPLVMDDEHCKRHILEQIKIGVVL